MYKNSFSSIGRKIMQKPVTRIIYTIALLLLFGAALGINASSVHAATISASANHLPSGAHLIKHAAAPISTNGEVSANTTTNKPTRVFGCKGERDGHFNILSDHNANWDCFEGSGILKNLAIYDANLVCTGNHTGTVTWYAGHNSYYVIPFPTKNVCSPLNDAYANYVMVTEIKIDPS
jgi:hypothetical protein